MKRFLLFLLGIIYFIINFILIIQWIIVLNGPFKPIHPWLVLFPLFLNFSAVYSLIRYNVYKTLFISLIFLSLIYFALFNLPNIEMNSELLPLTFSNIEFSLKVMYFFFASILCLIILKLITSKEQKASIKKYILEMSTKLTRLEIKEISEITKIDKDTIKNEARKMIENQEVYAKYFSTSKAIAFDQETNIAEIENLMAVYEKWDLENA